MFDEKGRLTKDFLAHCREQNLSLAQIKQLCGRSRPNIHRWLIRYGVATARQYAPRLDYGTVYELYAVQGLTAVRIGEMLGCHHSSVSQFIRRNGITPTWTQTINARRVPPLACDELLSLYVEQKLSARQIGERYGVSKATATRWLYDCHIPRRVREQRRGRKTQRSQAPSRRFGKDFSVTIRNQIFERDNWTCLLCGCQDSWLLEAHHIVPVVDGGLPVLTNGGTVCRPCHIKIKNREREYEQLFRQRILSSTQTCYIGETPNVFTNQAPGNTEGTS